MELRHNNYCNRPELHFDSHKELYAFVNAISRTISTGMFDEEAESLLDELKELVMLRYDIEFI